MRETICSSSFRRYSSSSHKHTENSISSLGTSHSQNSSHSQQKSKGSPDAALVPGVYRYYSDSDSDSDDLRTLHSEENHHTSNVISDSETDPEINIKRTRREDRDSNAPDLPLANPYFPSSLTEIFDLAIANSISSDHQESPEFNAFDRNILDLSKQINSIQLHKDSESFVLSNLHSKICQKEIEFLSQMESFTSMRKRKIKHDHHNDLKNISEIENQIQQSLAEEEKILSLKQLDKLCNLNGATATAVNYRELLSLLAKFDVIINEQEDRRVRNTASPASPPSQFSLSLNEEKKLLEYEKFGRKCQKLLQRLEEVNQELQSLLKSQEKESQEMIRGLVQQLNSSSHLLDPLADRLRRGKDPIVQMSDSLVQRATLALQKLTQQVASQAPAAASAAPTSVPVRSKTVPAAPATNIISSVSSTSASSVPRAEGIDFLLTDATDDTTLSEEKKSLDIWIRNLLEEYNQTIASLSLPADDSPLATLLQEILKKLSTLFLLPEEKRTTTRLTAEISFLEQSLKTASTLPSPSASSSISALQCSLLLIFSYLLEYVIRSDSEEKILFFGHLSGAICRACGKIGGKVLYAFLCSCALQHSPSSSSASSSVDLNAEEPMLSSPLAIPFVSNSQQRKRLVLFYATQMGSVSAPSRVDIAAGWAWLVRCGIMISRFIHDASSGSGSRHLLAELCSALRGYLRIIGTDLQLTYGARFMSLVTVISSSLASFPTSGRGQEPIPELSDLQILLKEFLNSGRLPCVLFKQKDSYSIYASSVIRALMKLKKESDELDADRSPDKVALKKYLEVAALASAFNILGPDPESHQRAIDMLTQHISRASSCEHGSYLWFVLFKIAKECLDFCQTPQWSVENAAPLAIVICHLCTAFPNLSELYRMQFYKLCPMTIPLLSVEGEGDAMMLSLGFNGKKVQYLFSSIPALCYGTRFLPFLPPIPSPSSCSAHRSRCLSPFPFPSLPDSLPLLCPPPPLSVVPLSPPPQGKDGKIVWEQPSKWLVRMNKIIGTYATVIINNSENPLNFKDGWLWLSKLVNYCVRVPTEPAPHTAKLLDTFLRITSSEMSAQYGSHFHAVIRTISDKVIPKLSENNSFVQSQAHKEQLQDFINTYLQSNGRTCLSVLSEM